jgi:hypothetical protein
MGKGSLDGTKWSKVRVQALQRPPHSRLPLSGLPERAGGFSSLLFKIEFCESV